MKLKQAEKLILKMLKKANKSFINSRVVVLKIPEIENRGIAGKALSELCNKGVLERHSGLNKRINYFILDKIKESD